jgi:hypothetical protein
MSDYEALREAAEKATPGPWRRSGSWIMAPSRYLVALWGEGWKVEEADATYIAAANPTTILALLDRLQAAERVVEAARELDDEQSPELRHAWDAAAQAVANALLA